MNGPLSPLRFRLAVCVALACLLASMLPGARPAHAAGAGESVDQALCRLIDGAAAAQGLPADFLTRLIWRESSFRHRIVSNKGAQGIAQFMPGTAAERGLKDPFDPEQAIPAAASLLADLRRQFGNLGLAAAAYNAGPGRVQGFLSGRGLPGETRLYVRIITGRDAEDWVAARHPAPTSPPEKSAPAAEVGKDAAAGVAPPGAGDAAKPDAAPPPDCLTVVAALRKGERAPDLDGGGSFAPWGVQVAGAFSKNVALAGYQRAATRFGTAMGDAAPMIIGTRLPGRGRGAYYRVRLPAQTRAEANALCERLHKAGGGCIVLAN